MSLRTFIELVLPYHPTCNTTQIAVAYAKIIRELRILKKIGLTWKLRWNLDWKMPPETCSKYHVKEVKKLFQVHDMLVQLK